MIIGRSKASSLNGTLLRVFPVVIKSHDVAVTVHEGEGGISQCAVHSKLGEGGPEGADNQLDAAVATTGAETADKDVIACADKAASGNIAQSRESGIDLKQAITGGGILSR